MSYRKQISYLELQENGQRIRSAGYARLESLEKEDILTVQLSGAEIISGKKLPLYLQRESGEQLLCEITADRGRACSEKKLPKKENEEQLLGIRVPINKNLEIRGQFAGKVSTPMNKPQIAAAEQTLQEGKTAEEETKIPEKNEPLQSMQKDKPEEKPEETPEETREEKPQRREEPTGTATKKPATQDTLHMKDTKWEQLNSIYPHIHPFRDAREFLSVGPEDFVVLRERCYQMTHNSFLLHGYYNYRHLVLMRQETPEQVRYYIGVPGNFYEREKQVARMFGFESFEGTREPAWEGDFGYYLISVEL